MSFYPNNNAEAGYSTGVDMIAIMRQVYLWMALGLAIAFGVAWYVGNAVTSSLSTSYTGRIITTSPLANPFVFIGSLVVYLGLGFFLQPIIMRSSVAVGTACYLLFTAVFGFMVSTIFLQYAPGPIASAFVATTAMFGALTPVVDTTTVA